MLRCDEKHVREYHVFNCVGLVFTTNHKSDGIYLPADDRRHFVAWSPLVREELDEGYFHRLWNWFAGGGIGHVTAYLRELDLSEFDPSAPPPKTPAFWDIVDASRAPEDAELADALDRLGNPDAVTLAAVVAATTDQEFAEWLGDRKNRRALPFRFEQCDYVPVRNDSHGDGLWVINGKRQVVYAKATLSLRDQIAAARRLTMRAV
jgi:hypothetical protein